VKLTIHLHPVPRLRMRGDIPPLPQYACMAWRSVKAQGQLYLYFMKYEVGGSEENYVKRNFMICTFHFTLLTKRISS
jgi:hypothetical protein